MQTTSYEKLCEAMVKRLTGYGGIKQAVGTYTIYKIARNRVVETVATGVVPIVLKSQKFGLESTLFGVYDDLSRSTSSAVRVRNGRFPYADDIPWAWENLRAVSFLMSIDLPDDAYPTVEGIKEATEAALSDLRAAITDPEQSTKAHQAVETLARVLRRASLETNETLLENIAA